MISRSDLEDHVAKIKVWQAFPSPAITYGYATGGNCYAETQVGPLMVRVEESTLDGALETLGKCVRSATAYLEGLDQPGPCPAKLVDPGQAPAKCKLQAGHAEDHSWDTRDGGPKDIPRCTRVFHSADHGLLRCTLREGHPDTCYWPQGLDVEGNPSEPKCTCPAADGMGDSHYHNRGCALHHV